MNLPKPLVPTKQNLATVDGIKSTMTQELADKLKSEQIGFTTNKTFPHTVYIGNIAISALTKYHQARYHSNGQIEGCFYATQNNNNNSKSDCDSLDDVMQWLKGQLQ